MNLKYLKHLAKQHASFIHPGGFAATQLLIKKLDIQPGEKILELGCGTGFTLAEIASRYDNKIYGVDVLDEMITATEERIKMVGLEDKVTVKISIPGTPLPFEEGTFDKIYMESVIGFQELQMFKMILEDVHRILTVGGIYIASEALWKDNVPQGRVNEICLSSEKDFGLAQASVSNITLTRFKYLAVAAGFEILEVLTLDGLKNNEAEKKSTKNKIFKKPLTLSYIANDLLYKIKLKKHVPEGLLVSGYMIIMRKV